jgi:TonB family protein
MSFVAVSASLLFAWTFSLFAKDFGVGEGEFDLSRLVAPVSIAPEAPPEPKPRSEASAKTAVVPKKIVLPEFYDSIGKTAPADTVGQKDVKDASKFDPGLLERGPESIPIDAGVRGNGSGEGIGRGGAGGGGGDGADDPTPPARAEPKVPKIVSGGVVNGRAVELVKPVYTAMARAVNAKGEVNVQVVIDEAGKVVSAKAVDGHPLLRDAAEKAAKSSRFSPTMLSNQAVKVSGTIVYRFSS